MRFLRDRGKSSREDRESQGYGLHFGGNLLRDASPAAALERREAYDEYSLDRSAWLVGRLTQNISAPDTKCSPWSATRAAERYSPDCE